MTGAGFSTTTADGSSLTLSAAEAVPGAAGGSARGLTGVLEAADGGRTEIAAMTAAIRTAESRIDLGEGVELRTALGYVIATEALSVGTDRTWAESKGSVAAEAPMGQLTAGQMRLDRADDKAPYLLVFKNGVRLLYQPQN